jgi:carbamoyl-phosphate synthase large subunit
MLQSLNMLVTSAGRRNHLIRCFREDAAHIGLTLRVVAADMQPDLSPACHAADSSHFVPRCTDADYIPSLLDICRREGVKLLVPTIDTELGVLSLHRDEFAAAGVLVAVSSPTVVKLAADKLDTARVLANAGVVTPITLTLEEFQANPAQLRWPVIAKPVSGSASAGILRPKSRDELLRVTANRYVVQECLAGAEFTVNIFFDADGALRCAVPHRRIEVRAGEVSKGRTERVPALIDVAAKLASVLPGARGALCFQAVVQEDGEYGVFEINARFGGGYPLAHRAGARFSQWLLEEALGRPSSARDDWRSGVTMLRFDDAIFIDG